MLWECARGFQHRLEFLFLTTPACSRILPPSHMLFPAVFAAFLLLAPDSLSAKAPRKMLQRKCDRKQAKVESKYSFVFSSNYWGEKKGCWEVSKTLAVPNRVNFFIFLTAVFKVSGSGREDTEWSFLLHRVHKTVPPVQKTQLVFLFWSIIPRLWIILPSVYKFSTAWMLRKRKWVRIRGCCEPFSTTWEREQCCLFRVLLICMIKTSHCRCKPMWSREVHVFLGHDFPVAQIPTPGWKASLLCWFSVFTRIWWA